MEQIQFHNYLRLVIISNDQGGAKLREIFRDRYQQLTGLQWQDGSQASLKFYKTVGQQIFQKSQKMQKEMLKTGDINQWDFALLAEVTQKIDYTAKLLVNKNEVETRQRMENDRISELVKIRNEIAHMPSKTVSAGEFSRLWDAVSSALISLGVLAEDINHVKSSKDIHGIQFLHVPGTFSEENIEKANQLRKQGNAVVKSSGNFEKAIQLYSEALSLFGLPARDRGIIHANRSAVYLMLLSRENRVSYDEEEIQEKLTSAENDAMQAVSCLPNWWKSYYRFGKVLHFKKDWKFALFAFDCALCLNEGDLELLNARDICRVEIRREKSQNTLDPKRLTYNLDEVNDLQLKFRLKKGKVPNVPKAINMQMYKKDLEDSDPVVQAGARVFFAFCHMEGMEGYRRDYKKAYKLFSQAASAGHAEGMYNVGLFHLLGYEVKQDVFLALNYFRKAAKCLPTRLNIDGVHGGQQGLGISYEEGIGVPQNYKTAMKWYKRAVNSGCGLAGDNIASMYLNGLGVEPCVERFIQYLTVSAVRGQVVAMEKLAGFMLFTGNKKQAQMWHEQSIRAGSVRAHLGSEQFSKRCKQFKIESFKKLKSPAETRFLQATNPMRVYITREHRRHIRSHFTNLLLENDELGFTVTEKSTVMFPANQQEAPAHLSDLQEITFQDIMLTFDQVHKGYVLHLTMIEDPVFNYMTSIIGLVKDANGDFMRCNLYNFDHNDHTLRSKLTFGAKFSILNPYHRLSAGDQGTTIRVDDPSSLIFESLSQEEKDICRFCWRLNPKHCCGKCKRAKYCGRECQEEDCKLLKHKLMCLTPSEFMILKQN